MAEEEQAFVNTRPIVHIKGIKRDEFDETVMNMMVNLPLNGMSHAEIKLSNWGMQSGMTNSDFLLLDIKLGDDLEIYLGEKNPVRIFFGEITAIEEIYGDGSPQLVLLMQDKLHRLARIRKSRSFENATIDSIVSQLAGEVSLQSDVNITTLSGTFHQVNESNLAFLLRLLAPLDIAMRLDEDKLRVRDEEGDRNPFKLDAQDNANNVRLLVDLNHQPTVGKVMGFNPANNSSVSGSNKALSPSPAFKTASDHLKALSWKGDDNFPQPFPQTQASADAYALGQFKKRAKRFINGDIRCRGEASLKSGREIELVGVSERLKGKYQVVNCIHSFNGTDGYETRLKVNRADWNV